VLTVDFYQYAMTENVAADVPIVNPCRVESRVRMSKVFGSLAAYSSWSSALVHIPHTP
jgi:hypothetical protein